MPATLADLVGGFQQGADWRSNFEAAQEKRKDQQAARKGRAIWLENEVGPEGMGDFQGLFDPYEMRIGNMFKGLFGGERRAARRRETALGGRDLGDQISMMADGGTVRRGRMGRTSMVAPNDQEDDGTNWNPIIEAGRSVGNVLSPDRGSAPAAFPGVRRSLSDTAEQFGEIGPEYRRYGGGARGAGRAVGQAVQATAGGALGLGIEAMKDISEPVTSFVGGALGLQEDSQNTPEAAAVAEQTPAEESAAATTPPAVGGAATPQSGSSPQEKVAESEALVDAASLGTADIDPADMPTFSTRDWVDYRKQYVTGAILQGMTPAEAHQQVSLMQHDGFMRYGQQAAAMLQAGNPMGAARALKAAYQYFPNGTDTQFGVQTGKNGEQLLVAYSLDEETGEPTGKAQAITPEYLASALTNFNDPSKFLAWTKDWRDEQFQRQKYEETEKPLAQSLLDYREGSLANQRLSALGSLARAQGAGGRDQGDLDRANAAFLDATEMLGFDDEAQAQQMASLMSQVYARKPNWQYPEVIDFIYKAYREGRLDDVKERLGVQ